DDFQSEPIPGLPARLPEGESISWQGRPDPAAIARSVMHRNKVAIYFAALVGWRVLVGLYDGRSIVDILGNVALTVALGAAALLILTVIAQAVARTTVYTITNKRVVMRIGVALPVTFNLPYSQILSADLSRGSDGTGTIALTLKEHTKISWAILWPHARPWKLAKPQPALRAVADVVPVANLLADHLREAHGVAQATENETAATTSAKKTSPAANRTTAASKLSDLGTLQPEGA
ncbi:MAG: photosynthetic complex putative assembly protein PuhB, partial [Pseudomonadota bacterium]